MSGTGRKPNDGRPCAGCGTNERVRNRSYCKLCEPIPEKPETAPADCPVCPARAGDPCVDLRSIRYSFKAPVACAQVHAARMRAA